MRIRRMALTSSLAGLLLSACTAMQPFEPPMPGEMNPEPGLFSGSTGVFVIRREASPEDHDEAAAPVEPRPRRLTDPPPPR